MADGFQNQEMNQETVQQNTYEQNASQGFEQNPYQQNPYQQGYQQNPYQQGYQQNPYQQGYQQVETKSKIAAGVLGILLGSLGIHKFYLGYTKAGLIMLLVSIVGSVLTLGIATLVMEIIGLIEGIIYLTKSDEEFYNIYVANQKQWF